MSPAHNVRLLNALHSRQMPFIFVDLTGLSVIKTKDQDWPRQAETIRGKAGFGKRRRRDWGGFRRIWPRRQHACKSPVRAGPGNPDPALRAADLASATRRTYFRSSLRLLSGSLHYFLRRAAPLSAQFGRSETFANAPCTLYRPFGNNLSKYLQPPSCHSAILAFTTAFLFNGTGSIH